MFDPIASCLQSSRHFGVLEAQVRWGRHGLSGPSHKDGATSLLHLGLTLSGRRVLRVGSFPSGSSAGNRQFNPWNEGRLPTNMDEKDRELALGESEVWDEDLWPSSYLKDVEMAPGSAYLSSPFCVEHAVRYCGCEEDEPVVAVQCRFGFSGTLGKELNDDRSEDMREVVGVIAESLRAASASGQLRMPTLGEVQREVERLRSGA
uniref:Uncharacterized protein n=1 Tax=Alexandrium catenella TaxID=2925 RepID=A0A7S1S743_ALECA